MENNVVSVILCGGSGTRLWPRSRSQYPKQFINIVDKDKSLFQQTVSRLGHLGEPIVVCNEQHRFIAAQQLNEIDTSPKALILEPESKNTAAAIALSALQAKRIYEDPVLVVTPADHYIESENLYSEAISKAIGVASQDRIALLGIKPSYPETGYGYIQAQEVGGATSKVKAFIEKPEKELAEEMLSFDNIYWNCGVFAFKASVIISELKKFCPEILSYCHESMENAYQDLDFTRIEADSFSQSPNQSIDYAVMENTELATVIPLDVGWSDVGSWESVWKLGKKDKDGNFSNKQNVFLDSKNCLVQSEGRLVSVVGLNDVAVVETPDAVLVVNKKESQDVKRLVELLKDKAPNIVEQHREVFRPWGKYDSVDRSSRYQVKRITVNPGQKLSVQMHHHRSEHWIVVSGTARVGINESMQLLTENQSIYIPLGSKHFLENPGKIPLQLIEVQSGSYLDEDDIVRFDDIYGRD